MKVQIIIECSNSKELKKHLKAAKKKALGYVIIEESKENVNFAFSSNDSGCFGWGVNEVHIRNC